MKKLLFILILLCSCSEKEDTAPANQDCKTCDVNVKYKQEGQITQYYIESSTEYCNGTWKTVDGNVNTNGGVYHGAKWTRTKTTTCH